MRAELASLESRLQYRFSTPALLHRALTHSSLAHEARGASGTPCDDNEQLEFLGDSILELCIKIVPSLPRKVAGLPVGLPGAPVLDLPASGMVLNGEHDG